MSEMTDPAVTTNTEVVLVKQKKPIAGALWGLMFGLGLALLLVSLKVIVLAIVPVIIVVIVGMALSIAWSIFGPAKPPPEMSTPET